MTLAERERIQSLINVLDTLNGHLKAIHTKLDDLARGQREDWTYMCDILQDLDAIRRSIR